MTALTAAYDAKRRDGELIAYPVGANAKIFKGALVCVLAATGLVQTGSDIAGVVFVGVAYETVDNTGGAGGARSVRVQKTGLYQFSSVGAAQTDVGRTAFLVDDNTVKTAATTNNIPAGVVVGYLGPTLLVIRPGVKVN